MNDAPEDVRKELEDRRAELGLELERLTAPPTENASVSFGKRVGDGTTEAVERLATTATAKSLATTIKDIDRALERLGTGDYGICETCGDDIPAQRLEALPATTRCVGCAARPR